MAVFPHCIDLKNVDSESG